MTPGDGQVMKLCGRCMESKPGDLFHRTKRTKDGLQGWCKSCSRVYALANAEKISARKKEVSAGCKDLNRVRSAAYYQANKRRVDAANKSYYERNKCSVSAYKRQWQIENKTAISEKASARYLERQEYHRSRARAYATANQEKVKANAKKYREVNKASINQRVRERYAKDPYAKASGLLRGLLKRLLRSTGQGKSDKTSQLLGYSATQLISRMEVQFKSGMSWANHGKWHIDHKIPLSHFVNKGETRPWVVNALCNLQPLWAEQNLRKGKSLTYWRPHEKANHIH